MIATAQILERDGPEAATTNAIAARAGVSIGSLYQYFGNRSALFEALAGRHVEQVRGILADALADLIREPLEPAVEGLLAALISSHRVNPRLDQALHRLMPAGAGILDESEDFAATMAATAIRTRPDLDIEDPELAGRVLVLAVGGVIRTTLRLQPERLSDPAFERTLVDLVMGFLERQRGSASRAQPC